MKVIYLVLLGVAFVAATDPQPIYEDEIEGAPEVPPDMTEVEPSEEPRTYCGRMLAAAQAIYCEGVEHVPQKKSRNTPSESAGKVWPWMTRRQTEEASTPRSKRIVGLVDECCHKPCYISDLLSYC